MEAEGAAPVQAFPILVASRLVSQILCQEVAQMDEVQVEEEEGWTAVEAGTGYIVEAEVEEGGRSWCSGSEEAEAEYIAGADCP